MGGRTVTPVWVTLPSDEEAAVLTCDVHPPVLLLRSEAESRWHALSPDSGVLRVPL